MVLLLMLLHVALVAGVRKGERDAISRDRARLGVAWRRRRGQVFSIVTGRICGSGGRVAAISVLIAVIVLPSARALLVFLLYWPGLGAASSPFAVSSWDNDVMFR